MNILNDVVRIDTKMHNIVGHIKNVAISSDSRYFLIEEEVDGDFPRLYIYRLTGEGIQKIIGPVIKNEKGVFYSFVAGTKFMVAYILSNKVIVYDFIDNDYNEIPFSSKGKIFFRPAHPQNAIVVIYAPIGVLKPSWNRKYLSLFKHIKFNQYIGEYRYYLEKVPSRVILIDDNEFYFPAVVKIQGTETKQLMILRSTQDKQYPLRIIEVGDNDIDFRDWDIEYLRKGLIIGAVNLSFKNSLLVYTIDITNEPKVLSLDINYVGKIKYVKLTKKSLYLVYIDSHERKYLIRISNEDILNNIKSLGGSLDLNALGYEKLYLGDYNITISDDEEISILWKWGNSEIVIAPVSKLIGDELKGDYGFNVGDNEAQVPIENVESPMRHELKDENHYSSVSSLTQKDYCTSDVRTIKSLLEDYNQIILYGPPGTGKTFLARTFLDCINASDNHYSFVTFHKSYSYEDFVEGYRPITRDGKIEYVIKDGIFKRIAIRAIYELMSDDIKEKLLPNHDKQIENHAKKIAWERLISDLKNNRIIREDVQVDSKGRLHVSKLIIYDGDDLIKRAESHKEILGDLESIFKTYKEEAEYEGIKFVVQRFLRILDSKISKNSLGIYDIKDLFSDTPKRFYIVIDEINRADVSHVFGELITLLEKDKRISQNNRSPIIVRLPYSRELFAIPENLYIIGTMNSADRGISLLDVALRRRFAFLEVQPDYHVLEGLEIHGIRIDRLLQAINNKIIQSKGSKDYQIGHAYFLELKSALSEGDKDQALKKFTMMWYHRILPLLQEYYYMRWDELGMKEFIDDTGMINWELMSSEEKFIDALKRLTE